MNLRKKNSFCSYCGHPFSPEQLWPRACTQCRSITYVNPLPVGIILLPLEEGILGIRRTIEPGYGKIALPGGFLEVGETWQEGCARELREETGVIIDPSEVQHFRSYSAAREGLLLVFGLAQPRRLAELPPFVANEETGERVLIPGSDELAFPLHTRVVREYFLQR